MKNQIRILSTLALLSALSSAHALTTLYLTKAGSSVPISSIDPGAVGSTFAVSVWYASDVDLLDGEVLLGYASGTSAGPGALPTGSLLDLATTTVSGSVSAAPGVALNGLSRAGGAGTGTRPFGLDALSVSSTSGTLAATTGARLFDVTLKNLGITAGKSATLSFHTAPSATLYRTSFIDGGLNEFAPNSNPVTVKAVPEPASLAALGLGALGLLRRRRR